MIALPHRSRTLTGASAATMVVELASRDIIDPDDAAAVLELDVVAVDQVTSYRREYQLGTNALWADATAIVGGKNDRWRVIDLLPRELSIPALRLDPPYEIRPCLKHTNDGAIVVALEYHYAVRAGVLVLRTVGHSMRIERVTLTTDFYA